MDDEEYNPEDYEAEERALPSLLFKQNIIQAHEKMIYYRARASLQWGGNDSREFIIWLKECFGFIKYELKRQIDKSAKGSKKDKENKEAQFKEMDAYLIMGKLAGINLSEEEKEKFFIYSDVVSEAIYKAGITDLKVREGDPVRKIKRGYR